MENYAISASHMPGWDHASQEIIPQPVPDPNNLGHYMKHFETLTSRRFPVFGKPRKESLVMEICRQRQTLTALPPNLQMIHAKLVNEYVQHLNDLKQGSQKRAAQRERKIRHSRNMYGDN